jgi:hypothetical protein
MRLDVHSCARIEFALLRTLLLTTCLAALPFLVAPVNAQSESGSAAIEGSIVDPTGLVVRAATVTLRNLETGLVRTTASDAAGRFIFQAVPVGAYAVDADAAGFPPAGIDRVVLTVGEAARVRITLTLPGVKEQVSVVADRPLVSTEASAASTVGQRAAENIPLRSRNFTEFVQLTPAVEQESDRFGLVIAGQRSINSNVAIDGADFNDPLQGNQRGGNEAAFFFPQTAIREFQVVRSGAGAEIGRTGAGFVNVVTKSGTNTVRGEAFYFNRHHSLTSVDAFGRKLHHLQNQFGGSLGGPIKADRAFFFGAVEQSFLRVPFVVKFLEQSAGTPIPPDLLALEGEQYGSNNPTAVFGRVDVQLSPAHRLNADYSYGRLSGEFSYFDSSQQSLAATTNSLRTTDSHAVKVALLSTRGAALVNDARAQVATDYRDERPKTASSQIAISGFGSIGGDPTRPRRFNSIRYQFLDNLSLVAGPHQWRVGVDLNISHVEQQRESYMQGQYTFGSLNDYVAGKISRYRQTISVLTPDALLFTGTQRELAFFAQDKISLGRSLSLSAGLRWEGQWNPQPTHPNPAISYTARIPDDTKMWQPRLGLAWSPGAASRTTIRASAGIFAARTPSNLFQRVFTDNGLTTVVVDSYADPNVLNYLTFPYPLTSLPPGLKASPPQVFGFDPAFQNPRNYQEGVSVERELRAGWRGSVSYIHSDSRHLQLRLDRNLYPPTYDATGMPKYPKGRPDPTIGILSVNQSTAEARYDGLQIAISGHHRRVDLGASYTLAWNKDNDSNERNFSRETTLDVFNVGAEWAYSKQDVRHHFTGSVVTYLGAGFVFSGVLIARSGFPLTAVIGSDTQNDANDANDRAIIDGVVVGRNSFRQPSFLNLDLRIAKSLTIGAGRRVEFIVDILNVTRESNKNYGTDSVSVFGKPNAPVATAGQSLFAPSTIRFGGPRQIQLGVRLTF